MTESIDIAALIPHAGRMCLLAGVRHWDARSLRAWASSHRAPDNPLRSRSGLLASAAIEYAAQAMAVHGALQARAGGVALRPGMLASARQVHWHTLRLDTLPGELQIDVTCLAGDTQQLLYRFDITHAHTPVASGRAAVVLDRA